MVKEPLATLKLDNSALKALLNQVSFVQAGRSVVLQAPLSRGRDLQTLIQDFNEKVYRPHRNELTAELDRIEMERRDKISPRSIAKPWDDRRVTTLDYFSPFKGAVPDSYQEGISEAIHYLIPGLDQAARSNNYLRPASLETVRGALKPTTSSGLPYMRKKNQVSVLASKHYLEKKFMQMPAVLFTRTGEENKTRDIWGFPLPSLIREGRYFLPLFKIASRSHALSALRGPDEVDISVTRLFKHKQDDELLVSNDFSAFDRSAKEELVSPIFSKLATHFNRKHLDEFLEMAEFFSHIGLVTPEGIIRGPHGVPSGSWFTNMIDSLVQASVTASTGYYHPLNLFQGDDGLLLVKRAHIDNFGDSMVRAGLTLNVDKSLKSPDDAVYLSRYYHQKYQSNGILRGVYPVYRALGRLLFQERFVNIDQIGISGEDYFSIRSITILENCKWHPAFFDLVKWVVNRDRTGLSFSESGLTKYVRSFESKSATDKINQYSDNVKGIRQFETYKIVRSLTK